MQHIQERGNCVAGGFANFCLLHQGLVENGDGVLLFLIGTILIVSIATLGFFSGRRARNVESHLDHLVLARARLLSLVLGAAVTIGLATIANGELDRYFVSPREVGIGNFRVRDLESRPILNTKRKLALIELRFTPVPSAERVLLDVDSRAIPIRKDFRQAVEVLKVKSKASVMVNAGRNRKVWYLLLKAI